MSMPRIEPDFLRFSPMDMFELGAGGAGGLAGHIHAHAHHHHGGGADTLTRPQLMDVLVDLRRTMEALDEARVRVANILNLPEPTPIHNPFYHDFVDIHSIARIRRRNRTLLDDAVAKCLIS